MRRNVLTNGTSAANFNPAESQKRYGERGYGARNDVTNHHDLLWIRGDQFRSHFAVSLAKNIRVKIGENKERGRGVCATETELSSALLISYGEKLTMTQSKGEAWEFL
jgi:hypothetical protein